MQAVLIVESDRPNPTAQKHAVIAFMPEAVPTLVYPIPLFMHVATLLPPLEERNCPTGQNLF